jgi:phosphate transport system protein
MSQHLHRAIEGIKQQLLGLSALVEESLFTAVRAMEERDPALAKKVIDGDSLIDHKEVEVEEECLKVLALHQPVATDLRFIVAVLKINNDLERIGDLAVNIANRATALVKLPPISKPLVDLQGLPSKVQKMLRKSLDSLVNLNGEVAREVMDADDEVDNINRSVHKQVISALKEFPAETERLILHLSVSRNLERIADHTTNVAEDVLYMINGVIVRHTKSM